MAKQSFGEQLVSAFINWFLKLDESSLAREMLRPFALGVQNIRAEKAEAKFVDSVIEYVEKFGDNDLIREDKWMEKMERFMNTVDRNEAPFLHDRFKMLKQAVDKIPEQKEDMMKFAQEEPHRFHEQIQDLNLIRNRFCEEAGERLHNWVDDNRNVITLDRQIENTLKDIRAQRIASAKTRNPIIDVNLATGTIPKVITRL